MRVIVIERLWFYIFVIGLTYLRHLTPLLPKTLRQWCYEPLFLYSV